MKTVELPIAYNVKFVTIRYIANHVINVDKKRCLVIEGVKSLALILGIDESKVLIRRYKYNFFDR